MDRTQKHNKSDSTMNSSLDSGKLLGKFSKLVPMALDFCSAVVLGCYGLLIGPLGILRGPIVFRRSFNYIVILVSQGLMTRAILAAIDWRMGSFDAAIAQWEGIVATTESYFENKQTASCRRTLQDMYTILTRAYLHAGHIDAAMLVVIRARRHVGVKRLPGLAALDSKTAHLVRAGLAAGRLLDGGDVAAMFVKSTAKDMAKRQGATAKPKLDREPQPAPKDAPTEAGSAKIIPFPTTFEHTE